MTFQQWILPVVFNASNHVEGQDVLNQLMWFCMPDRVRMEYRRPGSFQIVYYPLVEADRLRISAVFEHLSLLFEQIAYRDLYGRGGLRETVSGIHHVAVLAYLLLKLQFPDEVPHESAELDQHITNLCLCHRHPYGLPKQIGELRALMLDAHRLVEEASKKVQQPKSSLTLKRIDLSRFWSKLPNEIRNRIIEKVAMPDEESFKSSTLPTITYEKPHIGLLLPLRLVNRQFYDFADQKMKQLEFPTKQLIRLQNGKLSYGLENRRVHLYIDSTVIETDRVFSRLFEITDHVKR